MTSESGATSGPESPAAPLSTDGAGSDFGVRLAGRVRPRSIVRRGHVDRPLLGAIGRSSVGFGRAIGRAGAMRPVVTVNDLNSLVLRPPTPKRWRADDPVAYERLHDPSVSDGAPAPPTASRSGSVSAVRSVVRRTWTDWLVDAPAETAPGAPATPPTDAAPGFVATGDRKLDALRRMMHGDVAPPPPADASRSAAAQAQLPPWLRESGDTGARGGLDTAAGRTPRVDPSSGSPAEAQWPGDTAARRAADGGSRGDTAAGSTTAPGRLGERLRPEATDVDAATAAYSDRRRDASRSPAPPPMPTGGTNGPGRSMGSGGGRTPRGRGRSQTTRKMDALRRMLEDSGKLPRSEPPPDDGDTRARTGPAGGDPSAGRPATVSDAGSRPDESEPTGRDPSARTPAPPADAASAPGTTEPGPVPGETGARRAPSREDRMRALRRAAHTTGRDGPSGTLADGFGGSRRAPDTSGFDARPGTVADGFGGSRRAPDTSGFDARPGTVADGFGGSRRAPDTSGFDARPGTVGDGSGHSPRDTGRGDDGTGAGSLRDAHLDPAVARTLRTQDLGSSVGSDTAVATAVMQRGSIRPPIPGLPGRRHAAGETLRRVTLPRAMSSTHRPAPGRAATEHPTGAGRHPHPLDPVRPASVAPPAAVDRPPTSRGSVAGSFSTVTPSGTAELADHADHIDPDLASSGHGAVGRGATNLLRAVVRRHPQVAAAPDQHEVGASPAPVPGGRDGAVREERRVADGGPPTSADELSERFMAELEARTRSTPAPLPVQYQPMASVIAGERRVRVSTDDRSRRALRAVGKKAATTGDVIHLDPRSASGPERDEVLAHELTHVAHPSPAPRFFDDLDDSPEERRAEQVARIMARSPLAPSSSVAAAPSQPAPARSDRSRGVVRRSPAPRPPRSGGGATNGTIDAESLAAGITGARSARSPAAGTSTDTSAGTIRRKVAIGQHRAEPPADATSTSAPAGAPDDGSRAHDDPRAPGGLTDEDFMGLVERNLSRVTRLLERRMLEELERRGGRYWRGF